MTDPDSDAADGPRGDPFPDTGLHRRRRAADAARLFPILGLILFCAPLLAPAGEAGLGGSILWFFGCWGGLIALMVPLSRALRGPVDGGDGTRGDG